MNQRNLILAAVVAAFIILAGGLVAYNAVLGETETASGPITAPTLVVQATTPPAVAAAQPTATTVPPVAAEASPPAAVATDTAAVPTAVQVAENGSALPATGSGLVVYAISQAESEARFTIFEELRGSPKNVIGATDQVAGQVAVDMNDLTTAQVGEILVNARTLLTDDNRRNGAIRNRILFTDQYEFISFKPAQVSGLSGSAVAGQTYTFQVAGDLTIRDVTQPAVFDVTITMETPERLVGSAKTTVQRSNFGINIPSVPFVANVGEDVTIEIEFVLSPQS